MSEMYNVYHQEIPDFLQEILKTPPMQRLKDIGVECGCRYTGFPVFSKYTMYSRFDHSLGVAMILWHFTKDKKQTLSGLFHDIATPAFSHTIDFLHGDHIKQEYTEAKTRSIIENSPDIQKFLKTQNICVDEICDPAAYPLADNSLPHICADRLDVTFGNLLHYQIADINLLKTYYHDLTVLKNEKNEPEIGFIHTTYAITFARLSMQPYNIYISNETRWSMQAIALVLRRGLDTGVLTQQDLWTTEPEVIEKLQKNPDCARRLKEIASTKTLKVTKKPINAKSMQIPSKKRYIDPLTSSGSRVSELDGLFAKQKENLLNKDFSVWLTAD